MARPRGVREGFARVEVADDFHGADHPFEADVAHVWVIPEARGEAGEGLRFRLEMGNGVFGFKKAEAGEGCRAAEGVAGVAVAVEERLQLGEIPEECVEYFQRCDGRREREIPAAKALGQ